jgi:hypothetical protein
MIWHLCNNGRSHAFEKENYRLSICGCVRLKGPPVEAPKVYTCASCEKLAKRRKEMKIKIEVDCKNAALHENLEVELRRILNTATDKVLRQLERDDRCICEALESDDKLLDINGNTVGFLKLERS